MREPLLVDLTTHSEQHGDFLRLMVEDSDAAEKERRGTPVRLPYAQSSFTDVISMKARHISHSGATEAHGVLLIMTRLRLGHR